MTVNNLNECKASRQTVDSLAIENLSDRPNAATVLGGDNLSADGLKKRFDSLGRYLATQLNKLIEYLSAGVDDLLVTDPADDTLKTLQQVLCALATPSAASTGVTIGAGNVTDVQSALNVLFDALSVLSSGVIKRDGSQNMNVTYVPTAAKSVATKEYVDQQVASVDASGGAGTVDMSDYDGDGLAVDGDGLLALDRTSYATNIQAGLVKVGDGLSISSGAIGLDREDYATANQAGIVKVGDGLTIGVTGALGVDRTSYATTVTAGLVSVGEGLSATNGNLSTKLRHNVVRHDVVDGAYFPTDIASYVDEVVIYGHTDLPTTFDFTTPRGMYSLSDLGGVTLTSSGKNLFRCGATAGTTDGLTVSVSDGEVAIQAASATTDDVTISLSGTYAISLLQGVRYTLSCGNGSGNTLSDADDIEICLMSDGSTIASVNPGDSVSFTAAASLDDGEIYLCVSAGVTVANAETLQVQLERGSMTQYAPYAQSSVTLSTANGLGNRMLNGVGDVFDLVDSLQGVIVNRYRSIIVSVPNGATVESFKGNYTTADGITHDYVVTVDATLDIGLGEHPPMAGTPVYCSHFGNTVDYVKGWVEFVEGKLVVHLPAASYAETLVTYNGNPVNTTTRFKNWINDASTKLRIMYRLATDEVTPLSSDTLTALSTIPTYEGGTYVKATHGVYYPHALVACHAAETTDRVALKDPSGHTLRPLTDDRAIETYDGRLLVQHLLDNERKAPVRYRLSISAQTFTQNNGRYERTLQLSGLTVGDVVLCANDPQFCCDYDLSITVSDGSVKFGIDSLPVGDAELDFVVFKCNTVDID